jgi:hypothetical protein
MTKVSQIMAVTLALILSLGVTGALAQNTTNTTQGTTFEEEGGLTGNDTGQPLVPIPAPEPTQTQTGNESQAQTTGNETAGGGGNVTAGQNLTQVKEQAIPLLDSAEKDIQDARDLIRGLQEQLAAAQGEGQQVVTEANDSAAEVVDIVKENVSADQGTVNIVGNKTDQVVETINATINGTITPEQSENVTEQAEEVVDVVDEAIQGTDNATISTQADTAMIRLLTGLVNAQDYTALPADQKANLKADLADTIADIADETADNLRESGSE